MLRTAITIKATLTATRAAICPRRATVPVTIHAWPVRAVAIRITIASTIALTAVTGIAFAKGGRTISPAVFCQHGSAGQAT
jgi:hypothetical protein